MRSLSGPIRELLGESGFRINQIETGYMRGPKPMTFMYEVSLIRFRGHNPKGGYDVQKGITQSGTTRVTTVH